MTPLSEVVVPSTDFGLVSVIMNCFNGEPFVKEALESVVNQTYSNWELIFFDNRSTDGSIGLASALQDDRVRIVSSTEFLPLGQARMEALKLATGSTVTFLDTDDYWQPDNLRSKLNVLQSSKADVVYSAYHRLAGNSKKTVNFRTKHVQGPELLNDFLRRPRIGFLTLLIRRAALEDLEYSIDPSFDIIHDFDLIVRLATKHSFRMSRAVTAVHRVHAHSETARRTRKHAEEIERWCREKRSSEVFSAVSSVWRIEELAKRKMVEAMIHEGDRRGALRNLAKMRVSREYLRAGFKFLSTTVRGRNRSSR